MKAKLFFLLLCFILLFSCKKESKVVPDCLVGNWKHIKTDHSYNSYYPVSVPFPTSGGSVIMPTDISTIKIEANGYIELSKNNERVMYEDFFATQEQNNRYNLHYYGTPESESTDYFSVECRSDTLIVYGFFPYKSYSEHYSGGHGGIYTFYNYANYFIRH